MTHDNAVGCFTHQDCDPDEECYSGQCTSPCRPGSNPCPPSATCLTLTHSATCVCPEGYTGVPLQGCTLLSTCGFNSECSENEACIDRLCQDPCKTTSCAKGAFCRVTDHRPTCFCPEGYTGTPEVACFRTECDTNNECPLGHLCQGGACQDRCSECGQGALCHAENDLIICVCPSGFTGNPRLGCDPSKTFFPCLSYYIIVYDCDMAITFYPSLCYHFFHSFIPFFDTIFLTLTSV